MNERDRHPDAGQLARRIKAWGRELGFQQVGICDTDLGRAERRLQAWLADGHHGEMEYMARHGLKRSRPPLLVEGTRSIVSVRMDYLPADDDPAAVLGDPLAAYVSRYALGRDYHKLMRNRLQRLARRIEQAIGPFGYRCFVDSAPVLEKPLAEKAGLGWRGKHSNLVNRRAGCWFFLGEIYTDLSLPLDTPEADHCGRCSACIDACPTGAIVAPYRVDARRCISYLTIELAGPIPVSLRPLLGNRIYGCDDCLLACPWNRFASPTPEPDFAPRNGLDRARLLALFDWDEKTFLKRLEGSPIRRIGHLRWLRNIAIALGNAGPAPGVAAALERRRGHPSELVREHVAWALERVVE
ncbi:MAG TPA: tRNA epoxyqueuosine(34) reductase QueG [Sedimenticola thiotaurini]|uniref:Epoxyqueuosine reductase n=1 Tax=Sedimenticola thiotaurini TaxID=1543721 RepID=A0A831RN03_9GAMM|nr:tRNA epoxyqueuosine(34) reductase QueG [Sedimenticola thiotaurini]